MQKEKVYVGFWRRTGAALVDTIILLIITVPPLIYIYGSEYWTSEEFVMFYGAWDVLISWVFPMLAIIAFWYFKSATPGKMLFDAVIVDAKTGNKPTIKQWFVRYLGYYIACLPLGLGILWVAWDKRKQGWHDKLAGTVVVPEEL